MQTIKRWLSCFIILFALGCTDIQKPGSNGTRNISAAQARLQDLAASYRKDYGSADSLSKDSIVAKYQQALDDYLKSIPLDSFRVSVQELHIDGRTIGGTLPCSKDVQFIFSIRFEENKKEDSLYEFIKGLKPGIDTMVSLHYSGGGYVVAPPDSVRLAVRILACPMPLNFRVKD